MTEHCCWFRRYAVNRTQIHVPQGLVSLVLGKAYTYPVIKMNPCLLCVITNRPLLVDHFTQYWNYSLTFIYVSNYLVNLWALLLFMSCLQHHAGSSQLQTPFLHFLLLFALLCALEGWSLWTTSPGLPFLRLLLSRADGKPGRRWWAEREAPVGRHLLLRPSWQFFLLLLQI